MCNWYLSMSVPTPLVKQFLDMPWNSIRSCIVKEQDKFPSACIVFGNILPRDDHLDDARFYFNLALGGACKKLGAKLLQEVTFYGTCIGQMSCTSTKRVPSCLAMKSQRLLIRNYTHGSISNQDCILHVCTPLTKRKKKKKVKNLNNSNGGLHVLQIDHKEQHREVCIMIYLQPWRQQHWAAWIPDKNGWACFPYILERGRRGLGGDWS